MQMDVSRPGGNKSNPKREGNIEVSRSLLQNRRQENYVPLSSILSENGDDVLDMA